ncbi:receptor-like protein 9DC3 [Solanum stenotomum]|uniref:receptor-like protein 9DC3 n=1 Tax=Solanum stenotomum TaxID=172797 RepID=UPI0020D1A884|nr:receptor-like protein 9DC3 [Solanum stenotomum]
MELNLYRVNFIGKIPESFSHLTSLRRLTIASCNLSGSIPKPLWNLTSIEKLDLGYNHLGKNNFDSQLEFLSFNRSWAQLKLLDFSSNSLTGPIPLIFERHIPSIIGDLVGLRTLNLSHNHLEGHIPASLHQLSVLESLDLSSNKISREILQQLASLTFLVVLNLSHNHLVGCIPKGKQFDTFENSSYQGNDGLRGLPLSKDCGGDEGVPQATTTYGLDQEEEDGDSTIINWQAVLMGYGSITSNVSGMQNLHSLFLSSNHLNGTIPSWIFSLPSLSYLDLSDNHFSGNIGLDQEDGLRGLPLSKDCGGDEGVPQATTTYGLDQEEEEGDSTIINWIQVHCIVGIRIEAFNFIHKCLRVAHNAQNDSVTTQAIVVFA